jgi:hypothetical protein
VGQTACLRVPLDRFYMEENLAPEMDAAFREHSRPSERNAYFTVRIRDGSAAIVNLWIGGVPIRDFVARAQARISGNRPPD